MDTIEINSSNYTEFQNLYIIGFSLTHAGGQGEGGCIKIVTSDGKLYHTNICHSIKLEEAFSICPPLKDCHFSIFNTKIPVGWAFFYMGGGNFLVIKEQFKNSLSLLSPNEQYWQWVNILQIIVKENK